MTQILPETMTQWEAIALTRWGRYIRRVENDELDAALEQLAPGGTVLDIGCDGGVWASVAHARGHRVVVTEATEGRLQVCSARLPDARAILVDPAATTLPLGDGECDLVICIQVPPVANSAWFAPEAARVLKPEGLLVAQMYNLHSWRGLLAYARGHRNSFCLGYGEFVRRLRASGLTVLDAQGYCWFPFGRTSESPLVPVATALEKRLGLRAVPALSPWVIVRAQKTC